MRYVKNCRFSVFQVLCLLTSTQRQIKWLSIKTRSILFVQHMPGNTCPALARRTAFPLSPVASGSSDCGLLSRACQSRTSQGSLLQESSTAVGQVLCESVILCLVSS